MSALYDVRLLGCHDATDVTVNLQAHEVRFVERLVALVNEAGGGCHPTMRIEPHVHDEDCSEDHA